MYELRGVQDCYTIIERAAKMEASFNIPLGESQFRERPTGMRGGLAEEVAAGWILYTAVLMSWLYVARTGFDLGARMPWSTWPWILAALYLVLLLFALSPPVRQPQRLADIFRTPSRRGDHG